MADKIKCPHCNKSTVANASTCEHCGQSLSKKIDADAIELSRELKMKAKNTNQIITK